MFLWIIGCSCEGGIGAAADHKLSKAPKVEGLVYFVTFSSKTEKTVKVFLKLNLWNFCANSKRPETFFKDDIFVLIYLY